jgi:hypothetical protein
VLAERPWGRCCDETTFELVCDVLEFVRELDMLETIDEEFDVDIM